MSMSDRDGFIWFDGKLVPWREATTHVLTHSLHYGLSVFEGARAYKTDAGTAIFRLAEHTEQFLTPQPAQTEQQEWIAVELLAEQVVHRRDVLARVGVVRTRAVGLEVAQLLREQR